MEIRIVPDFIEVRMKPDLSSYESVRRYLYGLKYHGAKYGIERMHLLADELNHPENAYPVIHVAGTNGKGSVCAMLEEIYRSTGLKTGLYTSPHLVRQGERIQVNRRVLDEDEIVQMTRELQAYADRIAERDPDAHPSFFEFMTAMAFLKFKAEQVDLAVIETGLGGRLDATNVVREPLVSVITSISLDHIEILGNRIEKIAEEKSGIIKPGSPVVIGNVPEAAESVIRRIARERGCAVYSVKERYPAGPAALPETNLSGAFQRWNAGVATLVTEVLNERIPVDAAVRRRALQSVNWPGRWQEVDIDGKHLILDATHNPEGCRALVENLDTLLNRIGGKPDILVGTLGPFRSGILMPTVAQYARNLHLFEVAQPRTASFELLEQFIPPFFTGEVFRRSVVDVFPAPGICRIGEPGETLVITGSIYLIGEIAERLFHAAPVTDSELQDPIR